MTGNSETDTGWKETRGEEEACLEGRTEKQRAGNNKHGEKEREKKELLTVD